MNINTYEKNFFSNCYDCSIGSRFGYAHYDFQAAAYVIDHVYNIFLRRLTGDPCTSIELGELIIPWDNADETVLNFSAFNLLADAKEVVRSNRAKKWFNPVRVGYTDELAFIEAECNEFYKGDWCAQTTLLNALMLYNDWLAAFCKEHNIDVNVKFRTTIETEDGSIISRPATYDSAAGRLKKELYRLFNTLSEIFYQLQEQLLKRKGGKLTPKKRVPKKNYATTER